jgi:hypothetical protein
MFETHQKNAAFTLALDVEDVSGIRPRKDDATLGVCSRYRHGGIIPPATGERKRTVLRFLRRLRRPVSGGTPALPVDSRREVHYRTSM